MTKLGRPKLGHTILHYDLQSKRVYRFFLPIYRYTGIDVYRWTPYGLGGFKSTGTSDLEYSNLPDHVHTSSLLYKPKRSPELIVQGKT